VLALCIAALMWWMDWHIPLVRLLAPPWNSIGWGFIGIGLVVDALSVTAFIRAKTTVNPLCVDRATSLVVTGLYRVSRNPMYLGLIALLVGWALLLGSLAPLSVDRCIRAGDCHRSDSPGRGRACGKIWR